MRRASPVDGWSKLDFVCKEGLMSQADLANAITWKNLSLVSQDPGTSIPSAYMHLTNVPRSGQTDNSPANQASTAHVIRPF